MPKRVQMRRTKGWRKPESAVSVARGTKCGNPFMVGYAQVRMPPVTFLEKEWEYEGRCNKVSGEQNAYYHSDGSISFHQVEYATVEQCVELYRAYISGGGWPLDWNTRPEFTFEDIRRELGGKDLMCWCPMDQPCHADVLLEIANSKK